MHSNIHPATENSVPTCNRIWRNPIFDGGGGGKCIVENYDIIYYSKPPLQLSSPLSDVEILYKPPYYIMYIIIIMI